jgi:large subunit ribosomal protein L24
MKIKVNDIVIVISGKYKNAKGKVLKIDRVKNRCIVEGIAIAKIHKKATSREEKSEIVKKEASVHVSNIAYFDSKSSKAVKLGYVIEDKKKFRINKKTKEKING